MKVTRNELLNNPLWIWGAGNNGKAAIRFISEIKGRIKGIIDNDLTLRGSFLFGYTVCLPDDAFCKLSQNDIIVCCCTHENNLEILEQLKSTGINGNIREMDFSLFKGVQKRFGDFLDDGYEENKIVSKFCRQRDFRQDYFKRISGEIQWDYTSCIHRKNWEFVYIISILEELSMLQPGKRGIGFAVGEELLPSYFASKHVDILATDLSIDSVQAKEWAETGQNAGGNVDKLYKENLCSREEFDKYVTYRDLDMNDIPDDLGLFDFCWSSCAIEHVGSLNKSKEFIKNMTRILKPGGVGIHTTEFNLWSNDDTVETGYNVIFRRKDIEELSEWCSRNGFDMPVSFKRGDVEEGDMFLDFPPFGKGKYHLALFVGYASTSYGIVVIKH